MTATHGTGIKYGNIVSLVVSLEMVTPTGEVMVIYKGDDLFDPMVVSLGLLDVLFHITESSGRSRGFHWFPRNPLSKVMGRIMYLYYICVPIKTLKTYFVLLHNH